MAPGTVVDSDSHILEPATMWRDYIDPAYRSRAMGIELDELGLEYLDIDGKMSSGYNGGALGRIAGVAKDRDWLMELATLPYAEAANIAPAPPTPPKGSSTWPGRASTRPSCSPALAWAGKPSAKTQISPTLIAGPTTAGSSTSARTIRTSSSLWPTSPSERSSSESPSSNAPPRTT